MFSYFEASKREGTFPTLGEKKRSLPSWKIISFRWSRGRDRSRPCRRENERLRHPPLGPVSRLTFILGGKIFLAADDRRQRLPVVVTPINNPFFTSIPFFPSLFPPLPVIQFPRLPPRSICLRDCSGDHISPRGTRTIGKKTRELAISKENKIGTFLLNIENRFVKLFQYQLFAACNTSEYWISLI